MELSGTFALAHTLLGDLALRETHTVTILTDHELPRGKYTFAEALPGSGLRLPSHPDLGDA